MGSCCHLHGRQEEIGRNGDAMQCGQLSKGAPVSVGNAPHPPRVERLWRLSEMRSNDVCADGLDERIVSVKASGHAVEYQRSVYISRGQTFIGVAAAFMQKLGVANDPNFGERLRQFISESRYKNPRRFAIDGMGWGDQNGPQRLNQYLKGRIPEIETLLSIADRLEVSVNAVLGLSGVNSDAEEGLRDILLHLLSLEGIPPDRADTIASVSLEAQRLLKAFPEDEPLPTRAKYAARAAWLQQQTLATDR